MSTPAIRGEVVAAVLTGCRYDWRDEDDLVDGLVTALTTAGIVVEREVRLGRAGRIDLVTARIGIEVKIRGGTEAVARQLQRYADTGRFDALVLATTRSQHRTIPATLAGCPIVIAHLTRLC